MIYSDIKYTSSEIGLVKTLGTPFLIVLISIFTLDRVCDNSKRPLIPV